MGALVGTRYKQPNRAKLATCLQLDVQWQFLLDEMIDRIQT